MYKEVPLDPAVPYSADLHVLYQKSHLFRNFVDEDWDYVVIGDDDSLRRLIMEIQLYCDRGEPAAKAAEDTDRTVSMMLQLLTTQFLLKCSSAYYDSLQNTSSNYIDEVKKYISRNLDQEIRITDISAEVSINPSYLETLFKRQTGTTIVEYINQQRIGKAVSYLSSTDQSVTDIGYMIGYNNRQHFSRIFRKIMGVSPGQYRKNLKLARVQNYEDNKEPIVQGYYDDRE